MVEKRILCSHRLRRIPKQFSWVDHRLVRDKHLCGLSHPSLALYLFLVTVSDAEGLSYYSDAAIERHLDLNALLLSQVRAELCAAGLIAYRRPLYQTLSLDESSFRSPAVLGDCAAERESGGLSAFGDVLLQALGGRDD